MHNYNHSLFIPLSLPSHSSLTPFPLPYLTFSSAKLRHFAIIRKVFLTLCLFKMITSDIL